MTDVSTSREIRSDESEERARAAFDAVQRDHAGAESELRAIIADPGSGRPARMIALWGLGRLLHDSGQIHEALTAYPEAFTLAASAGHLTEAAQIEMSWALCLQASGDVQGALDLLDHAESHLDGGLLGRLLMQRGMVFMYLGRSAESAAELDRALALLRIAGDQLAEARLLSSRGVVRVQLGDLDGARADFTDSLAIAESLGEELIVAGAHHNLGYVAGQANDVPEALRQFARARQRYAEQGSPGRLIAALDADECEMHLLAGLGDEALTVARRVLDDATAAGNTIQVAEAHLVVAKAALLVGDRSLAEHHARRAAGSFTDTGREPWAALATYVAEMARFEDEDPATGSNGERRVDSARLHVVAETLERTGWRAAASEVRVLTSRMAIAAGDLEAARRELGASTRRRYGGTPAQRAEAWFATALLRLAGGDRRGAKSAIGSGLRVVDRHRATFGARELRARSSVHGTALANLGVRLAIAGGRGRDVLSAAERWRAGALVGPTGDVDGVTATDLGELHRRENELRALLLETTEPDTDPAIGRMRSAVDRLEQEITRSARLVRGDPRSVSARLDIPGLRRTLAGRTLVEFVESDGLLHAVVVTERKSRLVALGAVTEIETATDHLMFALRRAALVSARETPVPGDALEGVWSGAAELDELLIAPLGLRTAAGLVVVPPTSVQPIAWTVLPGLRALPELTIAPSAAWWRNAGERRPSSQQPTRTVLVAGPDLSGAIDEIDAIAPVHPSALTFAGSAATVDAVLAAMNGADVVHVAAHGSFRADNPTFSALRLADGPLFVHDLERLVDPPRLVVLTSCHAGRSRVYPGDELIGTATALLSVGVRAVIAPVVAVPDRATVRFAIDLHEELARGATPPGALVSAVALAIDRADAAETMAAASFHCIAAADRPVSSVAAAAL